MTFNGNLAKTSAFSLLICLSACVQPGEVTRAKQSATKTHADIQSNMATATLQDLQPHNSALTVVSDRPFLGLAPIDRSQELPERLRGPRAVSIPKLNSLSSLPEFARTLEKTTYIPVKILGRSLKEEDSISLALKTSENVNGDYWIGPLDTLLDIICQQDGYEWRYQDGSIQIIRSKTAIIKINVSPVPRKYESVVSSGVASDGNGKTSSNITSSTQSIKASYEYNPWKDIENQLKAIQDEETTKLQVSQQSGDITVFGPPAEVNRIKKYAQYINDTYRRRVNLMVNFVRVDRTEAADYQADWDFSLANVFKTLDLTYAMDGASNVLGIIKDPGTTVKDRLNATLQALNKLGTVTRTFRVGVPALNRQPVEWHNQNLQTIPESTSTTSTGDTITQDVNVASITNGLQLSYTPNIIDGDTVSIDLNLSIQDPPVLEDYVTAGATIKLVKQYKDRSISAPLVLKSGDVAILNGFSDNTTSSAQAGVGDARNWGMGGLTQGSTENTEHLILVMADVPPPMKIRVTEIMGADF